MTAKGTEINRPTDERVASNGRCAVTNERTVGRVYGARWCCRQEKGEANKADTDDGNDRANNVSAWSPISGFY